jgi:POT family proton-dependent oligopeptide transporter
MARSLDRSSRRGSAVRATTDASRIPTSSATSSPERFLLLRHQLDPGGRTWCSSCTFTDAKAASWQSLFKSGAYFFPMLGAIVSDVFWASSARSSSSRCVLRGLARRSRSRPTTDPRARMLPRRLRHRRDQALRVDQRGDQFTEKNAHLIERAFSWFYIAINAGSSISIFMCPWLLRHRWLRPALGLSGSRA